MSYHFEFRPVLARADLLIQGLLVTIGLTVAAVIVGTALGIILASARAMRGGIVRLLIDSYVEVFRNTPFLVQLFLLYFALPSLGLRMTVTEAALIGMAVNLGAYAEEIIRAGIESIHRSQIEAGLSLGLTPVQIFRRIVIPPAIANVYPALCSQYVLMMLGSSLCSVIAMQELTAVSAQIGSDTYHFFEVYIIVTLLYLALVLLMRGALAFLGNLMFGRGTLFFGRSVRVTARPVSAGAP